MNQLLPNQGLLHPSPVRRIASVAFLLATLFGAGCGRGDGSKNSVSGKVSLNGQPVAGTVAFIGADNKEVSGPISPDGTYLVKNPPLGEVKITVKGFPGASAGRAGGPPPGFKRPAMPQTEAVKGMPTTSTTAMGVPPPARYARPTNGLTFNVTGGKQTHNIELKP